MTWLLSPRWSLRTGPCPGLVGPESQKIGLTQAQAEGLSSGQVDYGRLLARSDAGDVVAWLRQLIDQRVLVPDYVVDPSSHGPSARQFFEAVVTTICDKLALNGAANHFRNGLAAWSGPAIELPLSSSRDYLPGRPAWCFEMLQTRHEGLRLGLDCRNPLLTPWENIGFAQETFLAHLEYGHELLTRVCDLVFTDPLRFTNPRVKYLHPAVQWRPDGVDVSAYWNLGSGRDNQELWQRALEMVRTLGIPSRRLESFCSEFASVGRPELLGHNFTRHGPQYLKVYLMFDGMNANLVSRALDIENCTRSAPPMQKALHSLSRLGMNPGRNLGILTLYLPFDCHSEPALKVHFNLRDGFSRRVTTHEVSSLVSDVLKDHAEGIQSLPNHLELGDGGTCQLRPHTLAFQFTARQGLRKATVYVNFVEEKVG